MSNENLSTAYRVCLMLKEYDDKLVRLSEQSVLLREQMFSTSQHFYNKSNILSQETARIIARHESLHRLANNLSERVSKILSDGGLPNDVEFELNLRWTEFEENRKFARLMFDHLIEDVKQWMGSNISALRAFIEKANVKSPI